jgi:hypothetical protein
VQVKYTPLPFSLRYTKWLMRFSRCSIRLVIAAMCASIHGGMRSCSRRRHVRCRRVFDHPSLAGLTAVGLRLRTPPASPGIAGTEWLSRSPRVQSQGLRLLLCCSVGTDDGMVLISYMYYYCYHWNVIYAIILITWGNGKRGSAVRTGQ